MTILHEPSASHPESLATRRPLFVFRWEGWGHWWRDFAIMQIGFILVALWPTLLRQAHVDHLIPWGVVEHGIADKLSIDIGFAYVLATIAAILLSLIVRETFGWGSVLNFAFMTFLWADVMEQVVPDLHTSSLAGQLAWVFLAVPIGALGAAIYLSVNAGAGPRDNLMLAIARLLHTNVGVARVILEAGLVGIGLLLGGSIGWVTVAHIAVAGPAIWFAFRLLRLVRLNEFWGTARTTSDRVGHTGHEPTIA